MSISSASPVPLRAARARRDPRRNRGGAPLPLPLRLWLRRWHERHALWSLDPEQMRDAGLTGYDVRREADKPFWRA